VPTHSKEIFVVRLPVDTRQRLLFVVRLQQTHRKPAPRAAPQHTPPTPTPSPPNSPSGPTGPHPSTSPIRTQTRPYPRTQDTLAAPLISCSFSNPPPRLLAPSSLARLDLLTAVAAQPPDGCGVPMARAPGHHGHELLATPAEEATAAPSSWLRQRRRRALDPEAAQARASSSPSSPTGGLTDSPIAASPTSLDTDRLAAAGSSQHGPGSPSPVAVAVAAVTSCGGPDPRDPGEKGRGRARPSFSGRRRRMFQWCGRRASSPPPSPTGGHTGSRR
jgi:hypothetical protein